MKNITINNEKENLKILFCILIFIILSLSVIHAEDTAGGSSGAGSSGSTTPSGDSSQAASQGATGVNLGDNFKPDPSLDQRTRENLGNINEYAKGHFEENKGSYGKVEIDKNTQGMTVYDSSGNEFAKIPKGYDIEKDPDKFLAKNNGADPNSELEIKGNKVKTEKGSEVSYSEKEGKDTIKIQGTGDIDTGVKKIEGVKDGTFTIDEKTKQIESAHFTSAEGGNYEFESKAGKYTFKTEKGGEISWDANTKTIGGKGVTLTLPNGATFDSKQFNAALDGKGNPTRISATGGIARYADPTGQKYFGENLNIFYNNKDPAEVKMFDGNGIFLSDNMNNPTIFKGEVQYNDGKGLNYQGAGQATTTEFDKINKNFNVHNGAAEITNENKIIDVDSNGKVSISRNGLTSEKNFESFSVQSTNTENKVMKVVLNGENGNSYLYSYEEGKKRNVAIIPESYTGQIDSVQQIKGISADNLDREIRQVQDYMKTLDPEKDIKQIQALENQIASKTGEAYRLRGDYDSAIKTYSDYLDKAGSNGQGSSEYSKAILAQRAQAYIENAQNIGDISTIEGKVTKTIGGRDIFNPDQIIGNPVEGKITIYTKIKDGAEVPYAWSPGDGVGGAKIPLSQSTVPNDYPIEKYRGLTLTPRAYGEGPLLSASAAGLVNDLNNYMPEIQKNPNVLGAILRTTDGLISPRADYQTMVNDYQSAINDLTDIKVASSGEDRIRSSLVMGDALEQAGLHTQAMRQFEVGLDSKDTAIQSRAYLSIAVSQMNNGNVADAINNLQSAEQANPNNMQAKAMHLALDASLLGTANQAISGKDSALLNQYISSIGLDPKTSVNNQGFWQSLKDLWGGMGTIGLGQESGSVGESTSRFQVHSQEFNDISGKISSDQRGNLVLTAIVGNGNTLSQFSSASYNDQFEMVRKASGYGTDLTDGQRQDISAKVDAARNALQNPLLKSATGESVSQTDLNNYYGSISNNWQDMGQRFLSGKNVALIAATMASGGVISSALEGLGLGGTIEAFAATRTAAARALAVDSIAGSETAANIANLISGSLSTTAFDLAATSILPEELKPGYGFLPLGGVESQLAREGLSARSLGYTLSSEGKFIPVMETTATEAELVGAGLRRVEGTTGRYTSANGESIFLSPSQSSTLAESSLIPNKVIDDIDSLSIAAGQEGVANLARNQQELGDLFNTARTQFEEKIAARISSWDVEHPPFIADGRVYEGHAALRMDERRMFPTVVDDVIQSGEKGIGNAKVYRLNTAQDLGEAAGATEVFIKRNTANIRPGSGPLGTDQVSVTPQTVPSAPQNIMVFTSNGGKVIKTIFVKDDAGLAAWFRSNADEIIQ